MPSTDRPLPVLSATRSRRCRARALHLFRVGAFALILVLIHQQHAWYLAQQQGKADEALTVAELKHFYPTAEQLSAWDASHGGRAVVDAQGNPLGYVVQTAPISNTIVGYSGPNNTLIAFDADYKIIGIELLHSGDTPEHADIVVKDETFMHAFDGLTWDQAKEKQQVDGVSGATLTSLAVAEGIIFRLGGAKPSYRFPEPLTVDEVKPFFPQARELAPTPGKPEWMRVLDEHGNALGSVAHSSPTTDTIMGYQGPTDTLIALDPQQRVLGIAIRKSYDNEPYVGYVQVDEYFNTLFNGKRIDELAVMDLQQAQVEGVSGATMTSMAVAMGLVKAAAELTRERPATKRAFTLRLRDVGTVAVVLAALVIALTPLKGNRKLRIAFQLVLIGYLGLINGDMLSQAVVAGWAQSGVPWRFAPGMLLLVAAALLAPLTSKKQLYCHNICPHGAAQELLKHRVPWQWRLPRWLSHVLALVPIALLALVLVVAMRHLALSLVAIEPFDAYMLGIAGWATILIAIIGLLASLFVPMAYCRYGCPTGAMLSFLRFNAGSDRIGGRDVLVLLFLAAALGMRYWV